MADTRWLSDREMRAWLACIDLSTLLGDYLDQQLQHDAGMSHASYSLLTRLSTAPEGTLRMSELAERMRITRSRLSHALSGLEKRGWVRRKEDPADKRGHFAVLTEQGYAVLAQTAPGHVEAVRHAIFDQLTPDQVDQLAEIGETIIGALIGEKDYPAELPWRRR